MIQLYGHDLSGNSYKVRLFLSLLNLEFEWIKVDLITAEHSEVEHWNSLWSSASVMDGDVTHRMLKQFWCIWRVSMVVKSGCRWMPYPSTSNSLVRGG